MPNHESHELDVIQRWMQAVIAHPGGVEAGADSSQARSEIDVGAEHLDRVIHPSSKLGANDRIRVYANAYYGRLIDCMREEFPVLAGAIGPETFDSFAFAYLQAYPSTTYTLNELARQFPQYLNEARPDRDPDHPDDQPPLDWPDFVIDLATLEWTISEVFDAPGVEGKPILRPDDVLAVPADRWPRAKLHPVACMRLLHLRYPVNDYFTRARKADEGETVEFPDPADEYAVILRRDYVVRRYSVSRPQFELLSALEKGQPVGDAIERAAHFTDMSDDELAQSLHEWFRHWAAEGFFDRIELD